MDRDRSHRKYALAALALVLGSSLVLRGSLTRPPSGAWGPAGSLAQAGSAASAVALADGRVLVAGGLDSTGSASAGAELFSATGGFAPASSMAYPRSRHSAVTLKDGRVLVAGGADISGAAVATAEVYDPAGDAWTIAGAMIATRAGHTATLLGDGKVLIAGGESGGSALQSLELFDPASLSFSAVSGQLSSARKNHAAALLPDGRALIAGGSDGSAALQSTDIYDPATGDVTPGPAMTAARTSLTATTLLDGRVLLLGGNDGNVDLASAEMYDAGHISPVAAGMAMPRSGHSATLLPNNNQVLILGASAATDSAELFTPWTGTFSPTGSLSQARAAAAASAFAPAIEGVFMAAGGTDAGSTPLASTEMYGFATVKTDKDDYAPGETVIITGSGWAPGEVVQLTFKEVPFIDQPEPLTVTADEAGNIFDNTWAPDQLDAGLTLLLTASGTEHVAQTRFTDSVTSVTITSPTNGSPVTVSSLPTTITVAFDYVTSSSGATTAQADVLGTSATATKSVTPGTHSETIMATIPAGTANGSYNLKVTVFNSTGGGSNQKNDNQNNAVIVNVPTDTTPPVITPNVAGTLGNNNWYTSNVTVSWTVTDQESSITSSMGCGSSTISTDTTGTTLTCSATSTGGSSSQSVTIKRDATAPTANAARNPAANANGWNNTAVTVSFSGNDSVSGIASCTSPITLSNDGAGQSASGTCTDNAGNISGTATINNINIDKTKPTATATPSPGANANGWNNTDVTVSFAGSDTLSGIDFCTSPVTLTNEGANQSASGTCTDRAGNVSDTATASNINIDKTAPTLSFGTASPAANAAGWNHTDVSAPFTASDTLSGVASTDPGASPLLLTTEGTAVTGTVTVTDKAGNSATFTSSAFKIDKTAPTLTFGAASPAANANGWHNTDVSFSFTTNDTLSGVATTSPASSPLLLTIEGASVTGTVTVTDVAGNSATFTSLPVSIDKTKPTATATPSPGPNANGWNNTDVTVSFAGSDALSGIDFCTSPVTLSSEQANQSASGTCTDKAGNTSDTATASKINIDKTAPTITFLSQTPGANAAGWNNTDVTVTWTCSDSLSQPVSPSVQQIVSAEGAGQSTTGTCTDKAGNTASNTHSGINIDKTPPTISAAAERSPNPYGWYTQPVKITFTGTDGLSGVASCDSSIYSGPDSINASVSGGCKDVAGNLGVFTFVLKYDSTPPGLTASATIASPPGPYTAGTWVNQDVTVTFVCGDPTSGVSSVTPAAPVAVSTQGANQFVAGVCTNGAGLGTSAAFNGIDIDKTKPVTSNVVAIPVPVNSVGVGALTATITDPDPPTPNSGVDSARYIVLDSTGTNTIQQGSMTAVDGAFDKPVAEQVEQVKADIQPIDTTGVYYVCVVGKDVAGNEGLYPIASNDTCVLLAVYDASGGFVTGGGWIMSPEGAYVPDPSLTGKATFGFVSKYQKGASVPSGDTEFQFKAGNLNFKSKTYDWLVFSGSGSSKAQYKGVGTINGAGDYGFLLTAVDGDLKSPVVPDTFRIKIWERATSTIVYDNLMGFADTADPTTTIGGGSIVIHTTNGKK